MREQATEDMAVFLGHVESGFLTADLERIAQGFAGIERVYAVQAGREVRVHVFENQVSDSRATEMASEIAQRISRELTFPGQIKVMVIRELRAVELAG